MTGAGQGRHLFRAFFAQFFSSETVSSEAQLRQAIAGVLAFVLTPCLMLLPAGFGQFQQIAYRPGMRIAPGTLARLNAVHALAFEDLTEAVVGRLIAYSMIAIGLVAVYAWDALTFDRRDAVVLGPLPVRSSTVVTAKLAALAALLLGASLAINGLNSVLFAFETADRAGLGSLIRNFSSCFVVTMAAATLVFAVIVIARALAVAFGGARFAALLGSAFQLLLVAALLELVITAFVSPHQQARLAVVEMTTPPVTWFVAWFEVIRASARGRWPDVIAMSRQASVLVPAAAMAAVATSVLAFRCEMRRALSSSAAPGAIGHAYISGTIARLLCGRDRIARATSEFVLATIVRNRAQQTAIAMNAGIGVALVAFGFARHPGDSAALLLAAPLMLAFWIVIGLRAAFFVPSELPAAWTFAVNARPQLASYARGVRAAIVGLVAPPAAVAAWAAGGWHHAAVSLLLVATLGDIIVLTISFVPFTRSYRPGHARLKTRWPVYLSGAYAFAYGASHVPIAIVGVILVGLELAIGRAATRRWIMHSRADEIGDDEAVTLNLHGTADFEMSMTTDSPVGEPRQPVMRGTFGDVRYGLRLFARDPVFTAVVVGTLALAIGANVTLFAIVSGMGTGRPRIANEARAIVLASVDRSGHPIGVSYRDFDDWRSQTRTVAELAAYRGVGINLTDRGLAAERVTGAYVSAETFRLIGERPVLGRDFVAGDDRPGAPPVAILGGGVWKTRYGGDSAIVGRTIRANGVDVTVVGVMRPGFRFPLVHDLWMPLASAPGLATEPRDLRTLQVVGRLRPGVTLEHARAEFAAIGDRLAMSYPATNRDARAAVTTYTQNVSLANPWTAMLCAVSLVLLIGCANVANLLLARGARRGDEIAIRLSIGATRWQVIRQLLVEHSMIAAAAGTLGLLAGVGGVRLWIDSMPVANWPYWYDFTIDRHVFGYLCAVTAACALVFGVAPALTISRQRAAAHRARFWTGTLLTFEFTLTLALLAGAGLLARTLAAVYRVDSIVDTSDVVFAGIELPPQRYKTAEQRTIVYRTLEERLASAPDVEAATVASVSPFYTAPVWAVEIEGETIGSSAPRVASAVAVGPRYFETLRLRVRRGRPFTIDDGAPGHETVIVNERFAAMYMPGLDPLGRRIMLTDPRDPSTSQGWLTIVGVAPMVRQRYAQDFDPVVYVPYRSRPAPTMIVMARSARAGVPAAATLRRVLSSIDADLPLVNVMSLDQLLAGTRFANEAFATMFSAFAGIALLLAAVGLHAITAYAVTQRTREIGIRVALGARGSSVTWMFVRRALPPLAAGLILGTAASLGVGQLLKSTLAGTSAHDPATLAAIGAMLVGVVLASTFVPARRAARLDPAAALRHD